MWYCAGMIFFIAEVMALTVLFVRYRHGIFPFNMNAIALPVIAWAPWVAARRLLTIYKLSAESTISEEVQTNFSYHLANLVMFAYIPVIVAITMVK